MAQYMEAKTLAKDPYVYMATGQWKNANMGQPIKREFKDLCQEREQTNDYILNGFLFASSLWDKGLIIYRKMD